ncbi:MAG: response regulator [Phycisphaerales bacterium]|nr:response regulator [Phycisphaerales bacterium]
MADPAPTRPRHEFSEFFDNVGVGVGVVDAAGEVLWMSSRLAAHTPETLRLFTELCAEAIKQFSTSPTLHIRKRFASGTRFFELMISPTVDHRATGILLDVTIPTRMSDRLEAVDLAGADLLDLDAHIVNPLNVAERLALLEGKIASTMRILFHDQPFEVRLRNRRTEQLELVIGHGIDPLRIGESIFAKSTGNGISGWVASTGESYICRNLDTDPLAVPGLAGARSSLTVPLLLCDRVIGVVNVESLQADAFSDEDRLALETYGRYQAMALNILDMLIVERSSTSERVSAILREEVTLPQQRLRDATRDLAAGRLGAYEQLESALETLDARIKGATSGPRSVLGIDRLPRDRSRDPYITGKRILVADDDTVVRETIQGLLQEAGGIVENRPDGSAALELLRRAADEGRPFDLVISDVRMPDRNGYEVFRGTRECSPKCAFLMMTGFGYDPNHSIVRSTQDGLSHFLFKPFQASVLLEEVRKALGAAD